MKLQYNNDCRDATPEEEAELILVRAKLDARLASDNIAKERTAILAQIVALQQLALRALVEDLDTEWLDKRRAAIAALRAKL